MKSIVKKISENWLILPIIKGAKQPVFGKVRQDSSLAACGKQVGAVLESRQSYVLYESFNTGLKGEILRLQAVQRLKTQGVLLDDAKVSIAMKVVSKEPSQERYSIVTVPEIEMLSLLDVISVADMELSRIFPIHAAISALVGLVFKTPTIVFYGSESSLHVIVVVSGFPIYLQLIPLDTNNTLSEHMLYQAYEIIRLNIKRNHNIECEKIVVLGANTSYFPEMLGGYEFSKPDFSKFFSCEDPLDPIFYPELFGAFFADAAFDIIPAETHLRRKVSWVSFAAALVFGAISVAMWGGVALMHIENKKLDVMLRERVCALQNKSSALEALMPSEQERSGVEAYLSLISKLENEPRLDMFLLKFAKLVPLNVKVSSAKMLREAVGGAQASQEQASQEQAASQPLQNQLAIIPDKIVRTLDVASVLHVEFVSKGKYGEVEERFVIARDNLCREFDIFDFGWNYLEDKQEGRMKCSIMLKKNANSLNTDSKS